jgi:hypothetical protein
MAMKLTLTNHTARVMEIKTKHAARDMEIKTKHAADSGCIKTRHCKLRAVCLVSIIKVPANPTPILSRAYA